MVVRKKIEAPKKEPDPIRNCLTCKYMPDWKSHVLLGDYGMCRKPVPAPQNRPVSMKMLHIVRAYNVERGNYVYVYDKFKNPPVENCPTWEPKEQTDG